jgi:hypothetical protein
MTTAELTDILEARAQTPFRESAATGTRREIVIIEAGWGSSGYYSEAVLERDIPRIFPVGTQMYLDHPTLREDKERPERSVRDLVGVVVETPHMSGISSVTVCEIFEHWVPVIDAMAEHIGLSIRAFGTSERGDAGGKTGPIIKHLTEGVSIDYVTLAGAGGKVGPLVESAQAKVLPLIESARAARSVDEALNSDLNTNLEKAGEEKWGSKEPYTYVYLDNFDVDENWAVFSIRPSGSDRILKRISYVRNTDGDVALTGEGEEVERVTTYEPTEETDPLAAFADSAPSIISDDSDLSEALKTFIQETAEKAGRPDPFANNGSGRETKEAQMGDEAKLSELTESVRKLEEARKESDTKIATLEESDKKNSDRADRAEEALQLREAGQVVSDILAEHKELPEKAAARVVENSLRGELPTDSDGKLDKSVLQERARAKLREEIEYIGEASGRGKVRGVGSGDQLHESGGSNGGGSDEDKSALQKGFEARGMTESAAKAAAEGR